MTIIQKILDLFKLPDTSDTVSSVHTVTSYTPTPKMEQYYKREQIKKENNLNITYQDMVIYDMKPFDLKQPLISDGNFVCIELNDYNLNKAYEYLRYVNNLIKPFSKYYDNAVLPSKITIDYIFQGKLPASYIKLTPYTSTRKKSKYPFHLWLQYYGYYGFEYLYRLYFNQNGEIKKCDLSFNGKASERVSYQIQIRNAGSKNYVRRIDKTLYQEPYGTHTTYMYNE